MNSMEAKSVLESRLQLAMKALESMPNTWFSEELEILDIPKHLISKDYNKEGLFDSILEQSEVSYAVRDETLKADLVIDIYPQEIEISYLGGHNLLTSVIPVGVSNSLTWTDQECLTKKLQKVVLELATCLYYIRKECETPPEDQESRRWSSPLIKEKESSTEKNSYDQVLWPISNTKDLFKV